MKIGSITSFKALVIALSLFLGIGLNAEDANTSPYTRLEQYKILLEDFKQTEYNYAFTRDIHIRTIQFGTDEKEKVAAGLALYELDEEYRKKQKSIAGNINTLSTEVYEDISNNVDIPLDDYFFLVTLYEDHNINSLENIQFILKKALSKAQAKNNQNYVVLFKRSLADTYVEIEKFGIGYKYYKDLLDEKMDLVYSTNFEDDIIFGIFKILQTVHSNPDLMESMKVAGITDKDECLKEAIKVHDYLVANNYREIVIHYAEAVVWKMKNNELE